MKRHGSMNHIFRLVWSKVLNGWVAVAEKTRGRGKGSRRKLVAAALALSTGAALAAPIGGQLLTGAASLSQSGATTTIAQASQNLSLNWKSFNIAPQETVNFAQPSATAIAVNRIYDTNATHILGQLNANGQVFLINPNGILFGQGAQVNVGGLVASTLDFADSSLNGNVRSFSGSGTGSVVNQGTIKAAAGGYVALLGNHVSNQGVMAAQLGSVALGAGSAATLTFAGNSLLHMQVDQGVFNNLAENGGLIQADGGMVVMNAGASAALLASVVNNTGVIQARTVQNHEGSITLLGGMAAGTVNLGGTLDASAPNGGNGGFIETSAAHVKVADGARITSAAAAGLAGSWLIDPLDFTIAASGGDMTGSMLSASLGNGDVIIRSSAGTGAGAGDVNVNDTLAWSANKLTLNAQNNININTALNGSGSASLALEYGQAGLNAGNPSSYNVAAPVNLPSGSHFSTKLGSNGPLVAYTVLNSLGTAGSSSSSDLQGMAGNLAGNFALGSNIDARASAAWNAGAGFAPVGSGGSQFNGNFDGLGHLITGLSINRTEADVGLFGYVGAAGTIVNVGLAGGSVTGGSGSYGSNFGIGGLAGRNSGRIGNSYNTGSVAASGYAFGGGLVGNNYGSIVNSHATGAVSATHYGSIGGLVATNKGSISNSYASGNVTSSDGYAGGLVLTNAGGSIDHSYATGNVIASSYGGGLASGNSNGGSISNSHATGTVSGNNGTGGLVGSNADTGSSITSSYATGDVNASGTFVGGLVGISNQAAISNSYATGHVTGTNTVGGLVGYNIGTLSNSYASGLVSGSTRSGAVVGDNYNGNITSTYYNSTLNGARPGIGFAQAGHYTGTTGLTATQVKTASNFSAFTFTSTPGASGNRWVMVDVDGTLNNAGGALGATYPMLASEYSTTITNAHQLQLMAMNLNGSFKLGAGIAAATTASTGDVWHDSTFIPVGSNSTTFTGSLDGQGHVLSGLHINLPASDYVGLFGATGSAARIANVGLEGGSVTGRDHVGALAGANTGGVSTSYAGTPVAGRNDVGGLLGSNDGSVSDTYASGTAAGSAAVGGLVGLNSGSILTSYATGAASGSSNVGGLAGFSSGTILRSFWDTATSGDAGSAGGWAMGTADMQALANFSSSTAANGSANPAWNLASTWAIYDGHSYPLLRPFMTPLTVTANSASKTYDAAAYNGAGGVSFSTVTDGNLLGAATFAGGAQGAINVGSYSLTPAGFYSTGQHGYLITYADGTLQINPAALTVSGTVAANKAYDGTLAVTLNSGVLSGVQGGDAGQLALVQAGVLATKNAGGNIAVSVTDTLGGAAAGNYFLVQPSGLTANVSPASLVLGSSSVSKTYDGTLTASGTALVAGGTLFAGDTLGGGTFAFLDKNAGSGKAVRTSGVTLNDGNGGANYSVSYVDNSNGSIGVASLILSAGNVSKTYDGSLAAAGNAIVGGGTLFAGDTLAGGTFAFLDKNAGSGKAVRSSGVTLNDGNGGANYSVSYADNANGSISAASLTLSAGSVSKTYDGGLTASGTAIVGGGTLFAGDTLSGGTFAFLDKNAGSDKAVSTSGVTLNDGNGGANYLVSYANNNSGSIAAAGLAITGVTAAATKVYDGTLVAVLGGTPTVSATGSDAVTLGGIGAGAFADKNVGIGKAVTVSGFTLGGTDALNYTLLQPSGLTADVSAASLVLSSGNVSKTYDGSLAAAGSAIVSGGTLFAGDTLGGGSFAFTNRNAGTGNKTVTASNVTVNDGNSGANYSVSYADNTASSIGRASLILASSNVSKTYDGTLAAAGTAAVADGTLFAGDTLSGGSFAFSNRNAGSGKTVTASGITLNDGNGGANYSVSYADNTGSSISPASLTLGAGNVSKTYDGSLAAAGNAIVGGGTLFAGDTLSGGTFAFLDKNAGSNKAVSASGVTLNDGNGGANYQVSYANSNSGSIAAASLAITGVTAAGTQVYDGTLVAVLAGTPVVHAFGSDAVTPGIGGSGAFGDKNVGSGKAISISGFTLRGADAGNYVAVQPVGLKSSVTPAKLIYSAAPVAAFAGQAAGTLSGSVSGFAAGDSLAGSTVGTLAWVLDPAISNQPGAYAINGAGLSARNYVFAQAAGNAGALTLSPGTPPQPVLNATTSLVANVLALPVGAQAEAFDLSPTVTMAHESGTAAANSGDTAASDAHPVFDTRTSIGAMGPALRIVNGGMKLPDAMVNVNE